MDGRGFFLLLIVFSSVSSSFPCSEFVSDLYGEINCLRRLLSQCTSEKANRETRRATTTLPPSTTPLPTTTTTFPSTTSTTTSTTPAPPPSSSWNDQVTESSDDWPTPNSALIIDALKYELTREIETKIREANKKFDEKMASYQVQIEMEMKKINKEVRMIKLKVHRRANHEYILSDERESWYTASEICTQWGGHLVTIKDSRENSFVAGFIPLGESAWIGLNDIQRENDFVNANGEKTTYRKWEDGQPDNLYHNENCVEMMGGGEGRWRDSLCLLTKRFVCRRN
ncbi:hypothetical protein PMAYCL1PPCAC_11842 [Pristionchus mayeri]|uniref:C-type lectin domain-containing protein n=1 Tax=Pristionchus mayeri TaxID=1317129 RepID=A0AAN4ZHY3_9BILA|nr:hypothetical protein PMAYCL1PPCAC_11842 [Pristionchus mayeri]